MDLGDGAEAKIKLFQNIVMLHIGVKRSNYIFFLKVVMLHIKLKLTTLVAT